MTRRALAAAGAALALAAPGAQAAPDGDLARQCEPAGSQAQVVCYGGDVLVRDGQAYADPGRFEQGIRAYEASWAHRALRLQYELANDVGLANAPWLGTHNSFNSIAQVGPALSPVDSNQQLRLVDQLRLDMRSLEIDVHWFPSARAGGQEAPVVCHAGAVSDHDGCSTEPLLGPILDEIGGWLRDHPRQVLLLYIEDQLAGGYDTAAQAIAQSLGPLVYGTGSGGDCVEAPGTLTRGDVLAAGAQVVIVSGCGEGSAWRSLAFSWKQHRETGGPVGFQDYPDCGPDYSRADYDARLIRYFEDSTWLTAGATELSGGEQGGPLSPEVVAAMTRCGVDLFGFDQLKPGDGRAEAAVWSWAEEQPRRGSCALLRADGRWRSSRCQRKLPAACRAGTAWFVTAKPVWEKQADGECAKGGGVFDVPRTGYENELLKDAAGGERVLLGYERDGGWRAVSPR